MDDHGHDPDDASARNRHIWFAVIMAAVILTFAAISITVVAMTAGG